jgi:hypothetical protein
MSNCDRNTVAAQHAYGWVCLAGLWGPFREEEGWLWTIRTRKS